MDNENTMQTEQAEDLETSGAFDEGWETEQDIPEESDGSDIGWTFGDEGRETEEESDGEEAEADQQNADILASVFLKNG